MASPLRQLLAAFAPSRRATLSAIALVVVLAVCVAGVVAVLKKPDPFTQPGTTYSAGLLGGYELHMLNSGEFAVREWCDVCLPSGMAVSMGRWHEHSGGVLLTFASGESVLLRPRIEEDCIALVPDSPTDPLGSEPFHDSSC
jgi:hypothetical protein